MKAFAVRLGQNRALRAGVSCAVSVLALYLAVREISLPEIRLVFSLADWRLVALALLAMGIHHLAKAARWGLLLAPLRTARVPPLQFRETFLALMAGQMLNLVYPGRVGDLSRIWVIGGRGPGKAAAAGTLVLEKAVDTVCFAGLGGALALLIDLPSWLRGGLAGLGALVAGLWLLVWLVGRQPGWSGRIWDRLPRWLPVERLQAGLAAFRDGLSGLGRQRRLAGYGKVALWSLLAWSLSLAVNGLVAAALDMRFAGGIEALAAQILVLIGLQVGISVPSLPGRVGVFEYICVLALGVFGINAAAAFSYGVLLHLVVMLPILLAGWAALLMLGLDRRQVVDELTPGSAP